MITFDKRQYCIDILNYADTYQAKLKHCMRQSQVYADENYVHELVQELGAFSALIRLDCLNDMTMLHNDVNYAREQIEQFDNFGEYCYEMLKQAFDATNNAIVACNKLHYDIIDIIAPEHISVAVSSGYIAFNTFGSNGTLELMNFKRATGTGLYYDILMKNNSIHTSNIFEKIQPRLAELTELATCIEHLHGEGQLHQAIEQWHVLVNEQCFDAKVKAMPAFTATYGTYKDAWFQQEFSKQNAQIYCNMSMTRQNLTEVLFKQGRTKKIQYGTDYMKLLMLDYVNNQNFEFK